MQYMSRYADEIMRLIQNHPLEIKLDTKIEGRPPTSASSEFLTNKEQGDWAEKLILETINKDAHSYMAVPYGKSDSISAGDAGFEQFYNDYIEELNTIGKRPDILIFHKEDIPEGHIDLGDDSFVSQAVAALEVRSSSFLMNKYTAAMEKRTSDALERCSELKAQILAEPYGPLLKAKNTTLYTMLQNTTKEDFLELDFRAPSWSLTTELQTLTQMLKEMKNCIKTLHKRDYLSITPKVEDLALVARWINKFNVPHYYLQVFFDTAYIISFEDILKISSGIDREGFDFCIERDIKNQGKTTIKIKVFLADNIIKTIEMPNHCSVMKELDRGRLLFYVKFSGGRGDLNKDIFEEIVGK